jgi:hypothetical protein
MFDIYGWLFQVGSANPLLSWIGATRQKHSAFFCWIDFQWIKKVVGGEKSVH